MGSMSGGGGSGSSYSTQQVIPWKEQAQYLNPFFQQMFAGATGFKPPEVNRQGDIINDPKTGKPGVGEYITDINDPIYDRFLGTTATGEAVPGKLSYYGDKGNLWSTTPAGLEGNTRGLGSALKLTAAPTVAGFSPEETAAQKIIEARLRGFDTYQDPTTQNIYQTGANELIPSSKTALESIIKGTNAIDPATLAASTVAEPSYNISKPTIGTPNAINAPDITDTPIDFAYWRQLGERAGGAQNNPYLEDMITNAKENLRKEHFDYEVPSLNTTAEQAGRYGGNTWKELREDAYDRYLKNAGQVETTMRGEAYNTDANRAIQALGIGTDLAKSQADLDAAWRAKQAGMDYDALTKDYEANALAKRLTGELGLTAETSQAGNELSRGVQNALLSQEAGKTTAGFEQQANIQNIANILQGAPIAPEVAQSDYRDIANLAAVGEQKTAKAQDVIDAFVSQFENQMLEPYQRGALASAALSGDYGGTTISRVPSQSGGYF